MGTLMNMAKMGEMIKQARQRKGWSQERLGERVGCTGSHITYVEKGRHITLPLLESICDRLGLDLVEMRRLNDIEFLRKQIEKATDPDLRERLLNVLAEEGCEQPRVYRINDHLVQEGSEEYRQIQNLVKHPERFAVMEDAREAALLKEFRPMDDKQKSFVLELVSVLPKKSRKK